MTATILGSAAATLAQLAPFRSDDAAGRTFWLPPGVSSEAAQVDWVFYLIYWICLFFFVLVVALMVLFAWKYRRTRAGTWAPGPTHNTPIEVTWTIIPLLLVIVIFYVGLKGYVNLIEVPANAYEVNVVARKWTWEFRHRNGATEANVLKVPRGQPVKLTIQSDDVLHSVFIPAFRIKQDAVPNRTTYAWFQADRAGTYQLFCTEYCGTQHSSMTAMVLVLEPEEFERQIAADAAWIDQVPEAQLHIAGFRLFARCASCHSLDGRRLTGPSFWETHDKWGTSQALESGTGTVNRVVDENYIRDSILVPQQDIVPTYPRSMPSFQGQLKARELDALIAFIRRLDEVVDRSGKPVSGAN